MLQMLGCTRVRLMTNNPSKLDGLSRAGIDVFGRVPLHGPINADNRRYLAAKATRAGHQLDHVLGALAEPEPARVGAARMPVEPVLRVPETIARLRGDASWKTRLLLDGRRRRTPAIRR